MVNIGPQWKGDLSAHFIADVSQPRHEAKALAARLIRATAYAMKGGAKDVSFRVPADPLIASVQSASLLRLAQELQPETPAYRPEVGEARQQATTTRKGEAMT